MAKNIVDLLRRHGIQASAQRVAVAQYVLGTASHPSAQQVWERVRRSFPWISRATVYNTLKLFVDKGLLRELVLSEGALLYDAKVDPHHHFIDDKTGAIYDVPWEALKVSRVDSLPGFRVRNYQVVMRGRATGGAGARR
jgi:Fe2+ or Zn2+ uptake regulation protein